MDRRLGWGIRSSARLPRVTGECSAVILSPIAPSSIPVLIRVLFSMYLPVLSFLATPLLVPLLASSVSPLTPAPSACS